MVRDYDSSGGVLILYECFAFTDAASHYLECSEEIAPMTKIIVRLIFRKNTTTKPRVTVLIVIFIALFHSGVLKGCE